MLRREKICGRIDIEDPDSGIAVVHSTVNGKRRVEISVEAGGVTLHVVVKEPRSLAQRLWAAQNWVKGYSG